MEDIFSRFQENSAIRGRETSFILAEALVAPVLGSWRESLFAHEWLHQDGSIRKPSEMSETIRLRRKEAEELLDSTKIVDRPVLGIGIMDNIEIGSGRDIFLTLASRGVEKIPVHIPKSQTDEFRFFVRIP
ncbi:MAG: hypothetical protein KDJ26_02725 [Alphaproteobacteria bacterium]|jgi:hypothetical protein|nr:hypothetical protein [Alphaproteobacteria bacterium]MCB1550897.1 hypothetical protein [Alphaproteobacteria bacterium]MCB9985782.1 hypothetical protein [Micavibrio sp.]HRK97586.1 hypothetical protein [Alphaproteobacteria bacterium]